LGEYVELHAHSNFSLLDGAAFPERLVLAARDAGMASLALTDHDGLYGAPRFFKAARKAGIKPIIGAELTLEGGFHITLLVKNRTGYANLSRAITRSHLSGTKGNPRVSLSALAPYCEGLICLTGCKKGEVPALLLQGKKGEALEAAQRYRDLFGPHLYIELQHHLHPEDTRLCRQLAEVARVIGAGLVACNNVHYPKRDEVCLHDVLVCIKNRVTLDNSAPFRRANSEYYLKNGEEMRMLSPALPPEAMERTAAIAEACTFDLDFSSYSFPEFDLPPGTTASACLKRLSLEAARRRYGAVLPEEVSRRLLHELALIEGKGLCGYFLIVREIVEFARKNGISAQGRGSGASSLVAYLLGITPVDPMEHKLFVGRFLNEFAVPDIDIDIATHRREEVLRHVYDKYGEEHTAMVCTYVTFQGRNAVREVGKVLGVPAPLLDRMAKSIGAYGAAHALEDLKEVDEFRDLLGSEGWGHFRWLCEKIGDFPRHLSIHVGGMLVTSGPISEIVPLERARAEGRVVCQWDKDGVDDAGLIKVDLLGLRMLSLIDEAVALVKEHRGMDLGLDSLPCDDPAVYALISRADTVGVFQVESRAQMQTLPRLRPQSLEDLGAEVAIIRPGPLQGNMVHPYLRRRQGLEPVTHLHPLLGPILDESLGVILYQEQILQVAMAVAGFSSGEANLLRKAMSRKNAFSEVQKWRVRFIEGAKARAIGEPTADRIFDLIGGFAEFGFCKSHAMSFAILVYRSAFLKTYYPVEFYCALLDNQPMGFYLPEVIVGDAKRHGITILPVDINRSLWPCSVEGGSLRIGFRYVRRLGEERTGRILRAREQGAFTSFKDFYRRTRLDRDALQGLIAGGAFDVIEGSRRQVLWKSGFLDAYSRGGMDLEEIEGVPLDEMGWKEKLAAEYAVHGFSARGHVLDHYRETLMRMGTVKSSALEGCPSGKGVRVAGLIVCLQMPPTAKGFAFLTLEDEEGLINVVLRPDIYGAYRQIVRLSPLIVIEGRVEKKEGLRNIMAERVQRLAPPADRLPGL
jgi:error-prone DNA polymerase